MTGPRVAIVSDTVDDINGVALGLRRLVAESRRRGHHIELVGPGPRPDGGCGELTRIPPAMTAALPWYPQMTWSVPELPLLVGHFARHADLVQLSTPGPMGIAGLIAARMLGLPTIAQYHTEVADYAARQSGLAMLGAMVAPLVGWFYRQVDLCLAPSATVTKRLIRLGIPAGHIRRVPRGVDLERFHPMRRDPACLARFGVDAGPAVLYVGRLSAEKNIAGLLSAWSCVHSTLPSAHLVVVGEGPLASSVRGPGVRYVGPLEGDDLARVFASADVFAFPSETETFGNVVVEAAASGLPAVVTDVGAASEHILDGQTGRVTPGGDMPQFARAIVDLLEDDALRMGAARAARDHALRYNAAEAVEGTWAVYRAAMRRSLCEVAS